MEVVDALADQPEHEVRVAAGADEAVRPNQDAVTAPDLADEGCHLLAVGRALGRRGGGPPLSAALPPPVLEALAAPRGGGGRRRPGWGGEPQASVIRRLGPVRE